jgi:hypothetical protein
MIYGRGISVLIAIVTLASCATPQNGRPSRPPAQQIARPQCISKTRTVVDMWQCRTSPERLAFDYLAVADQETSSGGPLRVLSMKPAIVLDKRTKERCVSEFAHARVWSSGGETGELHVPAMCGGKRAELVWRVEGEFSRYLGVRS